MLKNLIFVFFRVNYTNYHVLFGLGATFLVAEKEERRAGRETSAKWAFARKNGFADREAALRQDRPGSV